MNILSIQGLSKTVGVKNLFSQVSFGIDQGDRVALIGINGSGKSTLLKILAGLEDYDHGILNTRRGIRISYLAQDPEFREDHTALDYIFASDLPEALVVHDYEAVCRALEETPHSEHLLERFDELTRRMDAASSWEYETRAKTVLTKLRITDFNARISTLSGGYRKRLALSRALLAEPDLLILDEPTNHMDADSIDWLEQYLQAFPGAVVLVTHDRYFLDRIAGSILEIEHQRIFSSKGNFSRYLEMKQKRESAEESGDNRSRGILKKELQWLGQGCKARTTKQQARIHRIEILRDNVPLPPRASLAFQVEPRRLGKNVVDLVNVAKSYDGRKIIDDFTYSFSRGERLGVIGPNGCGKTTLADLITGKTRPDKGTVKIGATVFFGYFDQETHEMDPAVKALDYVREEGGPMLPTPEGKFLPATIVMQSFLFTTQMQHTPTGKLSGGEKRRLYLVRTLMRNPNFLLLDEPTNDLDISTLQALEDFLDGYRGTLLVISHDRYFLDRTVDYVLSFEEDHEIRKYPGNYSVYSRLRRERAAERRSENLQNQAERHSKREKKQGRPRKISYMLKRELDRLEKEIPPMEKRLEQIGSQMEASASNYTALLELEKERKQLEDELETAMERWEELATLANGTIE